MSRPSCPNCGELDPGRFCPACGQRQRDPRRSVVEWLREVAADELALGARTPRTLATLFFRPGRLTLDWIEGRRARHLGAVRLFLVATAVFFAVTFFLGFPMGQGLEPGRLLDRPAVPVGADVEAIGWNAVAGYLQTVLTVAVFVMVPLFALWLRGVHGRGRERVFADHLVFSLHQHSVFLALLTLAWPFLFLGRTGRFVALALVAGAGVHALVAYRRVYGGRRWWLRAVGTAAGWTAMLVTTLLFGLGELSTLGDAPYDPARRYHAWRLWQAAHASDVARDSAVVRSLQRMALAEFESVDPVFLLEWGPYFMADLEVELDRPGAALRRIEAFRAEHPDEPVALGLASLAAARAGDSALARDYAGRFLERARTDPPAADAYVYDRFLVYREHARALLGRRTPAPPR